MRRWSRRSILKAAGAAAIAGAAPELAGATTQDADNLIERINSLPRPDDRLILLLPDGCQANVEPVQRRFTQGTGIDIDIRVAPVNEINTRLLLANGRDERVDLALPASYGLPNLVEASALLPLDKIVPSSVIGASQSLYPLADVYNRRVYGLQTDGDVYVMFYNRRLLEKPELADAYAAKYGVAPKPARTFDELDRLLRHYHAPDSDRYGGVLFRSPGFLAWEWWIRFHAKGRWPFDHSMRPQIDSSEGIAALQEMAEATRYLHPETSNAGLVRNWELFSTGKALCNIGWGGSQKYFRSINSNIRDDVLVAPTPGARFGDQIVEFGHFNWGWNYAVPRTSKYPRIGGLLAAYATHPSISSEAVRAGDGFFDPFHASHFDDPGIVEVYGENFLEVQRNMLETAIPDLYLAGKTRYLDALDAQIMRAVRNDAEPAAALRATAGLWNALTNELGRSSQIEQWRALQERYPASLRRRLT